MLREYRVRKLKQYIAGVEVVARKLDILIESGRELPGWAAQEWLDSTKLLAEYKEKLEQLEDR